MTNRFRQELIDQITKQSDIDVLIVGGGINGIGTFRDLALQGVKVLLIDKKDFCSGASSASSHMVHGGIRYLENGEFRLVKEAVQERNRLIENAPHLVKPLATTIPIFNWTSGLLNAPLKFVNLLDRPSERGAVVIKLGLMMYDAYTTGERTVPKHTFNLRQKSLSKFPKLNPDIICTATYYDAMMPAPERICMELLTEGLMASPDARAVNYFSVGNIEANGVEILDELSNGRILLQPKVIINAAGPWIDIANSAMGQETDMIGGTKGSHLVLNHPELLKAINGHEFFFENDDGRIVLIYPLKDRVMVGTSDIPIEDPEAAVCTPGEIDYFLEMVNRVFPGISVDRSHIVFTFSGVRPLPSSDAKSAGQISRDHKIEVLQVNGLPILNLIGGKWTTFRAFAEKTTNKTLKLLKRERHHSTKDRPILGGKNFPQTKADKQQWLQAQAQTFALSLDRVQQLFERYGTLTEVVAAYLAKAKDLPLKTHPGYTVRELQFLAEHELVVHLDDLILRRTMIGMLGETTLPLLKECAEAIGDVLQWGDDEKIAEVNRTREIFALEHLVEL